MKDNLKLDINRYEETERCAQTIYDKIAQIDVKYPLVTQSYIHHDELAKRRHTIHDVLIDEYLVKGVTDYYDLYEKAMDAPLTRDPKATQDKLNKLFKKTLVMAKDNFELAYNNKILDKTYDGKFSKFFATYVDQLVTEMNKFWNDEDKSLIQYFSHYLSFAKLFGPMSYYTPEGMESTVAGYFRQEDITLSEQEEWLLSHIIVCLGRLFYEINSKIDNKDIDSTAEQMRSRNPIAAYSLPTLGTARNDDDFATNIEIAKQVFTDPLSSPLIFFLQTRLTSKGNDFLDYLTSEGYLDENTVLTKRLPNDIGSKYIKYCEGKNKLFRYFITEQAYNKFKPSTAKLISQNMRDDYLYSRDGFQFLGDMHKDGTYKYTHYIEDVYMYLPDDATPEMSELPDRVKTKIRTVYAGSGHWALIGATYLYALQEDIMDRTAKAKFGRNFRANWSKPAILRQAITNMFDAIQANPKLFSVISADDKSGFDNYVPPHLTVPFYSYILANKFNISTNPYMYEQIAQLGAATRLANLWTPWGLLSIPHAVPSGMSFTNLVDSFCSLVLGMFSNIKFIYDNIADKQWIVDMMMQEADDDGLWTDERMSGIEVANEFKFIYAYTYYMMKHRIEPVVNGDDYSGLWITGMSMKDIAATYKQLGFIVHPTKGIASADVTEFSAKVFYRGATVKTMTQLDEDDDEYKLAEVYSNGIPFPRSVYKDIFKEDEPTKSEMIEDLGILDRITNHHEEMLSPVRFIDTHLSASYSKMGMTPYDYIKLQDQNTEEKKVTKICDPYDVVLAAGDDANYLKTSLAVIRDRTWDLSYEDIEEDADPFGMRRSVKYIRAKRNNDRSEIARLDNDITFEGTVTGDVSVNDEALEEHDSEPTVNNIQYLSREDRVHTASSRGWYYDELLFRALHAKGLLNIDDVQERQPKYAKYPVGRVKRIAADKIYGIYQRNGLANLFESLENKTFKGSLQWVKTLLNDTNATSVERSDNLKKSTLQLLWWQHFKA